MFISDSKNVQFPYGVCCFETLEARRLLTCGCGGYTSDFTDWDAEPPLIGNDVAYDEPSTDTAAPVARSVRFDLEEEGEHEVLEEDCECTPDHPGFRPGAVTRLTDAASGNDLWKDEEPDVYIVVEDGWWNHRRVFMRTEWNTIASTGWGGWNSKVGWNDVSVTQTVSVALQTQVGITLPPLQAGIQVESGAGVGITISTGPIWFGPDCATRYKAELQLKQITIIDQRWSANSEFVTETVFGPFTVRGAYRVDAWKQTAECIDPDPPEEEDDQPQPDPDPKDPGDLEYEEDGVLAFSRLSRDTVRSSPGILTGGTRATSGLGEVFLPGRLPSWEQLDFSDTPVKAL